MTDFAEVLATGFDDELEKLGFFKELKEKIFGPKVEGDPKVIEDESRFWRKFGRLGDFISGFVKAETVKRKGQEMVSFAGPDDPMLAIDALNATITGTGAPLAVSFKDHGPSGYFPRQNRVELLKGRTSWGYHEGGHVVGIEGMPDALRDPYIDFMQASYNYGPSTGLALLPNAILDAPGKRRKLSKWGPLAALVPSLPMLFEEGRANIIGGMTAKTRGDLLPYLGDVVPGYAAYAAEAAAIPLGLFMIHRAKERRLAAAQKAAQAEAAEHPMPKAAAATLGFADEIEKLGGIKTKLLVGGALALPFVPGVAKRTMMSGAQNFNEPGRAPRFGYGNVTSQPSHFPLLNRLRFNPILGGVVDTVKGGVGIAKEHGPTVARDFANFYGGPKIGHGR